MAQWLVFSQIWRILHIILEEAGPQLKELGIDTREYLILSKLKASPHPAQLAKELFLPASTMTSLTKNLEKQKFIARKTDSSDLRRFRFDICEKGETVLKKGRAIVDEIMARKLQRLSEAQITELQHLLGLLQEAD
jgi:DNA-binding MarR family transcriptional regulator